MDEERQPCLSPEERRGNNQPGPNQLGRNQPGRNMPQPASQAQRARDLIDLARSRNCGRTCVIEVTNSDSQRDLFDPIVFINAGHNSDPPDANISSKSHTVLVFEKRAYLPKGTSGVVSYAYAIVHDVEKRFAVFWEVPQIGPNKFGICWTTVDMTDAKTDEEIQEKKRTCTKETYQDFLRKSLPEDQLKLTQTREKYFSNSTVQTLKITTDDASVEGTMGANIHAILKINFCDIY